MDTLIERIAAYESPNVFNPWRQSDPLDIDGWTAAARRRERLSAHWDCNPLLVLVGEAPGYQGCHFSGVAFTNERLILDGRIPRVESTWRLTKRVKPWCEPSASVVWGKLHDLQIADRVVLWNAFAWHPHKPDEPMSNRTPTKAEQDAGLDILRAVVAYFDGCTVAAVGRVAAESLRRIGVTSIADLRHPSMGGANLFREQLSIAVSRLLPTT